MLRNANKLILATAVAAFALGGAAVAGQEKEDKAKAEEAAKRANIVTKEEVADPAKAEKAADKAAKEAMEHAEKPNN